MAQSILGLDIGTYSVKVATVSASFRNFQWTGYREYVIPHGERDRPERSAALGLDEVANSVGGINPVVVSSISGDRVMTRFVQLPFTERKRIDSILGFELEGQLPYSVEDFLYAYELMPTDDDTEGSDIFAAAVSRQYMAEQLSKLQAVGLDPRIVTLSSAAYMNLCQQINPDGCVAIVDIGHHTTDICIVNDGTLVQTRSVGRAGFAVTANIAERLKISFEEAEALKHAEGRLPGGEAVDNTPIVDAAIEALDPLVVALRMSIMAQRERTNAAVDKIIITGGGSRLVNTRQWLEQQLNIPVERLEMSDWSFNKVEQTNFELEGAAVCFGLALMPTRASDKTSNLNFRRGQFGYEGDYKFLRDKLPQLFAMAAVLLIAGMSYFFVRSASLDRKLDAQKEQLKAFTAEYFNDETLNFKRTLNRLRKPSNANETETGLPPMSAVAVLDTVTRIQHELNREENHSKAGGPQLGVPPGNTRSHSAVKRRGFVPSRMGMDNAIGRPMGLITPQHTAGPIPKPDHNPREERRKRIERAKEAKHSSNPENAGDKTNEPEPNETDGDESMSNEDTASLAENQLELREIKIDVYKSVVVTAETHASNHDGKEKFRQRLDEQPCFTDVKLADRGAITGDRHDGWIKFELKFRVKCDKDDGKKNKEQE